MRATIITLTALAAAALVAGCGGGTAGTTGTTTVTTTATQTVTVTTGTTTPTSTTATGPITALPWPPAGLKTGQNPVLRTPSGNIECAPPTKGGGVVCNAIKHEWTLPPKPASCEFEWTDAVFLQPTGRPGFWCSSNMAFYSGVYWPRFDFPYRTSLSGGGITCVSRVSGVTCTNRDKHGFFLSRQRVTFF